MKKNVQVLLDSADIKINGDRPWDIKIHDDRLYERVLSGGSLALGESYVDGWWDAEKLDQFFDKILSVRLDRKVINYRAVISSYLKALLVNLQKGKRAFKVGERHYDIGNDLYEVMLDKRMTYTCGYFKETDSLDEAQEAKLDLICKKLYLKPGMKVLDIGCGWGSFVKFAAEKYGVEAVGITISKEQAKLAKEKCKGLPVEIRLQDYRDVDEQFDAIVSIGMFEHVGCKNYREFMKVAHKNLKKGGLQMLHTIASNRSVRFTDPWIGKYIFPNSMLPSAKQIGKSIEGLFVLEDLHNFGVHYDKTLMAWYENFEKGWNKIKGNYDEKFFRLWSYYLLSSAASFRSRKNQLWQIVLSKGGVRGGYNSIR